MKKMLCVLTAAVLVLLAVLIPVPAVRAEGEMQNLTVTPFVFNSRKWGTGLVGNSDNITNDMVTVYPVNGKLTITYNADADEDVWKAYYQNNGIALQDVGIEKPEGAAKGAMVLLTGDGYSASDVAQFLDKNSDIWKDFTGGRRGFFPQFPLIGIEKGEDGAILVTKSGSWTILTAWMNAEGNYIEVGNGAFVECMKVKIEHTNNVNVSIELPEIVPFDVNNSQGYGVVHMPVIRPNGMHTNGGGVNGGRLRVDYNVAEKSIWEGLVTKDYRPRHRFEFEAPPNAKKAAIYYEEIAQEDDQTTVYDNNAISYMESDECSWKDLDDPDLSPEFIVMDYELNGNTITYQPITSNHFIYLAWKDEKGQLIDLGMGQYIVRLKVELAHENSETDKAWTKPYEPTEVNSPYDFAVPIAQERVKGYSILGVDPQKISADWDESVPGKVTLTLDLSEEEWIKAYHAQQMLGFPINVEIQLNQPAKLAGYYNTAITGSKPDRDIASGMVKSWHMRAEGGVADLGQVAAEYTTNVDQVTLVPESATHTIMVSWKMSEDENSPSYNLGSVDKPIFAEYLTVTVQHKNTAAFRFESQLSIPEENIIPNAGEMPTKKPHSFRNDQLVYYMDAVELQEELNRAASDAERNDLATVWTQIKAPEGAVAAELDGEETPIFRSRKIEIGNYMLDWRGNLIIGVRRFNHSIRWTMENGSHVDQMIGIEVNMIGNAYWMDMVDNVERMPQASIKRTDDFDGRYGVVITVLGDGQLLGKLSGSKIEYDKINSSVKVPQILVEVPENAVYYKSARGSGASLYLGEEMVREMNAYIQEAKPYEIERVDGKYMALWSFDTVKLVEVPGEFGTSTQVIMPDTIGYGEDCTAQVFIQWLDKDMNPITLRTVDGEAVNTQYVYYQLDMDLVKMNSDGVKSAEEITAPVEVPTIIGDKYELEIKKYQQEDQSKDGAHCEYVNISLKNKDLDIYTQPNGSVTIYMPYPDGLDYETCVQNDYKFVLRHFLDDNHSGYEDIELTLDPKGLFGEVSGFSPFLMCWETEKVESEQPDNGGTHYYPDYDENVGSAQDKPSDVAAAAFVVTCRKLNVRAGAGTEYSKIGQLARGESVTGKLLENGWIEFELADGTLGYISGQYVEIADPGAVEDTSLAGEWTVACRKLNVRKEASAASARVGQLVRGTAVNVVGSDERGEWVRIEWNGGYAWVCAKYLSE